MKKNWWYRFSFFIFLTLLASMALVPTVKKVSEESSFPFKNKINLGLDLQGGLYIVLGIDFKKVYQDEMKNLALQIQSVLKDEQVIVEIGELRTNEEMDPRHTIVVQNAEDVELAKEKVKEFFSTVVRLTNQNETELEYGIQQSLKIDIEKKSVTRSIEVIRNRIDEFGVTEPEIISQGNDRIVVQLPGVKDIERAKALIGRTAKLEFKIVNDDEAAKLNEWMEKAKKEGIEYKKGERFSAYVDKMNEFLKADIPKGYELAFEKDVNRITNDIDNYIPYLVEDFTKLTGDDLQDAAVRINQQEQMPYVSMTFKSKGAKLFEDITGKNVGKRMAIVLDGNVFSAPVIRQKIGGGSASIELGQGNYSDLLSQASDLALVLRAGALPVELVFEEQRIVGPSLGADSISSARSAGLIGASIVFLFILIYYKISGIIVVMTLGVNILYVLACLVGLEATLTLPGIAGIALTIGMAVDANIIIYERIKEELRSGASVLLAVEAGFSKAFWTILDANLTTAAAGFALLNFGTGPIRGFAVTLLIGIGATVYSAFFLSRLFFELYLDRNQNKNLSI
jgi:protein-export membrane protein SecD